MGVGTDVSITHDIVVTVINNNFYEHNEYNDIVIIQIMKAPRIKIIIYSPSYFVHQ